MMTSQKQQLAITKAQAAIGGAALFGAIGTCAMGATQWWVSSVLADETGRSFATDFRNHAFGFLTVWLGLILMFVVIGALLGAGIVHLRDRNQRQLSAAQPEG